MLKLFRRLRQDLLTKNNFSKYLLYAIGEISLVVIGILIALQIGNWNEALMEKAQEKELLNNLLDDLRAAREQSSKSIRAEELLVVDLIRTLNIHPDEGETPSSFYEDEKIGPILWDFESDIPIIKSYAEIKNTGKTALISNRDLREMFTNLEISLDRLENLVKDRLTVQQIRIDEIAESQLNFIRIFNSPASNLSVDLSNEPENDYLELLKDPRIRNLFAMKLALTEDVLSFRHDLQSEIDLIIQMIESEINKS
ncbi:DUF6090 family protein [Robiginitalea marina]|uniref:DUF6090 family protein n=1 Tax=Robiginitalea marina TaxID=2954105 RepID=A0ABT1AXD5_9FLAO|nr:DUF6090 family protein [Robiginitalea marina]MCO5724652.1 DUF6090 family protein [Robiginitalea marina]